MAVLGEPGGRGTEAFDPDPHIADYESGESLFDAWVGGFRTQAPPKEKKGSRNA